MSYNNGDMIPAITRKTIRLDVIAPMKAVPDMEFAASVSAIIAQVASFPPAISTRRQRRHTTAQ